MINRSSKKSYSNNLGIDDHLKNNGHITKEVPKKRASMNKADREQYFSCFHCNTEIESYTYDCPRCGCSPSPFIR